MSLQIVLDTNIVITLEKETRDSRWLVKRHDEGDIDIWIPAISASERTQGGGYLRNYSEFKRRIRRLSCREIRILLPIGHYGVTYWDACLYASDEMVDLEERIFLILFPSASYSWAEIAKSEGIDSNVDENNPALRKHRNRLCDASALWCHIHYGGDVFVTEDKHFLKKRKEFKEGVGVDLILRLKEVREWIEAQIET